MNADKNYVKWFKDIRLSDTPLVGGKNASLGQLMADTQQLGIRVPNGFAITADAYWDFVAYNKLQPGIDAAVASLKGAVDVSRVANAGSTIRALFYAALLPEEMARQIADAYQQLSAYYKEQALAVAVRSSATAEDLPGASFAGQQETYLNIAGVQPLLEHCKKSFASLYTDRAIVYRIEKGFATARIGLSVGVQKMVHADSGAAGVAFSLDTETGFKDVVLINGAFGLGELIVQGTIVPDEWVMFKTTFAQGFDALIEKKLGDKRSKMVYGSDQGVKTVPTTEAEQQSFCLSDQQVQELTRAVIAIEKRYSQLYNGWTPMDIEWAQDGIDHQLYIVQARPETVHAQRASTGKNYYEIYEHGPIKLPLIAQGQSIGQQIASGKAMIIPAVSQSARVQEGAIIVTTMTDPSWVPVLKKCAGIITQQGGRTCHAAIVSRELGIPALVGVADALTVIAEGQTITLDCSQGSTGFIYEGILPFKKRVIEQKQLAKPPVPLYANIADPDRAFSVAQLPIDGIGLARIEFIISNAIGIHPLALLYPDRVTDKKVQQNIAVKTKGFTNPAAFFVDTLARGVAMIAASVYPKKVIVRFSDFKSNEYRDLLGGVFFEPSEENPMIGFRGASRYYHALYKEAFALECAAIKQARAEGGLNNIAVMVPFVRTVPEAGAVVQELQHNGIVRGRDGLELIMMVELPVNALLIEQFAHCFDGFSIGSNDLTQLTLGVDRDSALVAPLFDEQNEAVKQLISLAITGAHAQKKSIGICGQAPSDSPAFAQWIIGQGIDYLSLNPDAYFAVAKCLEG